MSVMDATDTLFTSILDNMKGYKMAVVRVVGNSDYLFVEDIISTCIEKLLTDIRDGKTDLNDVCYKDTGQINHSYFNRMVVNRAIHVMRLKSSNHKSSEHLPSDTLDEVLAAPIDAVDEMEYVEQKLNEFGATNVHNNYHASIFRYIFIDGMSARKLSKETGVPRYAISKSKNHTQELVQGWLQEGRLKGLIMKVRSIIGVNEAGEQVIYPSFAAARREGFHNVKNKMDEGKDVKGYTFSYVDEEPEGIRTIEEALAEPATGMGDVVAKVLNHPLVAPLTNVVKDLVWGEDGDCGCEDRLNKWNEAMSFKRRKAVRFFTKEEYDRFKPFVDNPNLHMTVINARWIADLHSVIFDKPIANYPCTNCGGGRAYKQWRAALTTLFKEMEDKV